jgi:hypothetical protein
MKKLSIKDLKKIIESTIRDISEDAKDDNKKEIGIKLWKKLPDSSLDSEIDNFFSSSIEENKENELDTGKYAREVYRLIDHFDSLIDVKEIILRRALNYIGENYTKEDAKAIEDILSKKFGIHLSSKEKETLSVPVADRAGPGLGT